ncbi:restriction endonuclease [Hwanghaeella grinnelliae]|uniref:Restriction endonuclease n=1 Tax=Hwanghaeella grinnelliae TaxID=2500179 RepID=A0A3S2VPW4_9PROT|nr:restriction endonuclease [Hwanghaeella grinnelliae]RVU36189.1 restriction endonuclease [Hwanghaeella grinnelliae]
MSDYKDLEILVAKIQSELAPGAEVLHNQQLPGRHSGRKRQIDVLVKDRIGQYEVEIVIDCKDYKRPVDVKGVEEFNGLVQDVGAHKGVLVCPVGFSEAAKTRAEGLQISLYSPVDTDEHKWTASVMMQTVCDFRGAAMSFGLSMSAPLPFKLPYDFQYVSSVSNKAGENLGSMFDIAARKWNLGELPVEPGDHGDLRIFGENPHMDNGYGTNVRVDLRVGLKVHRQLFLGALPISQISGFRDEIAGGVITNAFEVGLVDPNEVLETWEKIESLDGLDPAEALLVQGLIGWDNDFPEHQTY